MLEDALAAMRNAVEAYRRAGESYWLPKAERRVAEIQAMLDDGKRSPP